MGTANLRPGVVAIGVVGLLALGGAGCTTPPPVTIPPCPNRVELEAQPADPVDFSQPRAVSEDGSAMVISKVVGTDVQLTERWVPPGAGRWPAGSLPLSELNGEQPRVSVWPDGNSVLFAGNRYASLPSQTPSALHRWNEPTNTVSDVAPPVAASPPAGVPYPVNVLRLSQDGHRVLWSQAFFEAPSTFRYVRTITDAKTDAVIWQGEADFGYTWSPGGRWVTGASLVASPETGDSHDVGSAIAALGVAYPGSPFKPEVTSDNGRFTYFDRFNSAIAPGKWDAVLWDWSTSAPVPVSLGDADQQQLVMLADTGSVVRARPDGADRATLIQSFVVGSQRQVGTLAAPVWGSDAEWAKASVDLRTVLFSQDTPQGYRLVAERCM